MKFRERGLLLAADRIADVDRGSLQSALDHPMASEEEEPDGRYDHAKGNHHVDRGEDVVSWDTFSSHGTAKSSAVLHAVHAEAIVGEDRQSGEEEKQGPHYAHHVVP